MVVITDGSDQHSRLRIEQLIQLTQSSLPQIFMVGFWGQEESDYYRQSGRTVTLVSGHEIDNPLQVFESIAKKSGAESFFPSSERDLKEVLERILGILRAQYTLAYYPENIERVRGIQVKVTPQRRRCKQRAAGRFQPKENPFTSTRPRARCPPWRIPIPGSRS